MRVKFWGTRGSIATPGMATVRYGGNTTCLEVLLEGGTRIVLDAGTGIRRLGDTLMNRAADRSIHLFLTHSHWDHIQGFPFFNPAYDRDRRIRIYGFHQAYDKLREILTNQMESKFFPVNFSDLNADIDFVEITEEEYPIGNARIRAIVNNHPGGSNGFRIDEGDRSLVFLTDNELCPADRPTTTWEEFVRFVAGANVLVHDAMYTAEELANRRGWGHSSYGEALDLAIESGVETCVLFHHDPSHDDDMIDRIVLECQRRLDREKSPQRVIAAREDSTLEV